MSANVAFERRGRRGRRTPKGLIVHTGDWKFDPDPQIGEASDVKKLEALGDEGWASIFLDNHDFPRLSANDIFVPQSRGQAKKNDG